MESMGRGRRGRQDHSHQIDEKWILKPFPDQNPATVGTNHQPNLENPTSTSSTSIPLNEPTTSVPTLEFIARTSKPATNRRNPAGVPRYRRGRGSKPRFVSAGAPNSSRAERSKEGEQEKEEEIKELGSVRQLNKEEVGEEEEEEEEKGGGHVSELKNDSNGERIEGPDSAEGVDCVGRMLEGLQLCVAEAELSEEELRINDQLQEDEVI